MREVAQRLGVMQKTTAATLTVAGTNGKGASATLAAAIYRAAGYRVGLYTSPHLLRYNERVEIDGAEVSDKLLCEAFDAVDNARREIVLTFFEFGTLAALWLFRRAAVEVQVLEVGLGGRLDAVNVIDPNCALLTNVGMDHVAWLGSNRELIGREKAGIFRRGAPAICADPDPPSSVTAVARQLGAPLRLIGEAFDYQPRQTGWDWHGVASRYVALPRPGFTGDFQLRNAAGVLAAVESLQPLLRVPESSIRAALPTVRLAGRLQRCGDLLLDVAHNAEAALCLADHLRSMGTESPEQLVVGMLSDKPVEAFARQLAPLFSRIYAAGLPEARRGLSGSALKLRLADIGIPVEAYNDVSTAIASARAGRQRMGSILVCGSFYTVSCALNQYENHHP